MWVFEKFFKYISCSGTQRLHATTACITYSIQYNRRSWLLNRINRQEITFDLYRSYWNDVIYFYCMSWLYIGNGYHFGHCYRFMSIILDKFKIHEYGKNMLSGNSSKPTSRQIGKFNENEISQRRTRQHAWTVINYESHNRDEGRRF